MKRSALWIVLLVVAAAFVAIFYLRQQEPTPVTDIADVETITVVEEAPAIRYPVPEVPPEEEEEPLPSLDESDPAVRERFPAVFEQREFGELIFLDQIIRRIVVTVDNLPRRTVPQKFLPLRPPAENFIPEDPEADATFIAPENYKRYTIYARLAEALEPQRVAAAYIRLYPLFQSAYAELGHPNAYFNDRLIEVIDHLLQTPEVDEPVALVRPKVYYLFADPALEALSGGQKILIRMGAQNAAAIKEHLRQFRLHISDLPEPQRELPEE